MPATATSTSEPLPAATPSAAGETPAADTAAQDGTAEKGSVGDIPGVGPSEVADLDTSILTANGYCVAAGRLSMRLCSAASAEMHHCQAHKCSLDEQLACLS